MRELVNDLLDEDQSTNSVKSGSSAALWQTAQCLAEAGACTIGLPNGVLISTQGGRKSGYALVSIKGAIRRLEQARAITATIDNWPLIVFCTDARETWSLISDDDPRDRRHLTGVRTINGLHVYCGGIDAAVNRALACAPYADVICYRASRLDLAEAQHFVSAIRASFPNKLLGLGFAPQSGADGSIEDRKISQLGYRYYFLSIAGSPIVTTFPENRVWAIFDDQGSILAENGFCSFGSIPIRTALT